MKKLFLFIILIIIILLCYSFYIVPKIILVNEYSLENSYIPDGFDGKKIVHFSDLLYSNDSKTNLSKLVETINNQKSDIVFFTGDLINDKIPAKKKKELITNLSKIEASIGKYAILGDKDKEDSESILTESGFTILTEEINLYNDDLTPIVISNDCIFENTIETLSICLIHKPDEIDKIEINKPALILAGHSLGGQIRISFWGALIKNEGAKKYSDNYYKIKDSQMYISYGIGNGNINLRIFNEPSINVYRLKKQ